MKYRSQNSHDPTSTNKAADNAEADRITSTFMILFEVLNKQINLNEEDYNHTKSMLTDALSGKTSEENLPREAKLTALEIKFRQKEIDHRNEVEKINKRISELRKGDANKQHNGGPFGNSQREFENNTDKSLFSELYFQTLTNTTIPNVLVLNQTIHKNVQTAPNDSNLIISQQNRDKSC